MIAVVFGSSGGIGQALTEGVVASGRYETVFAVSRSGAEIAGAINLTAEFTDAEALAAVADEIRKAGPVSLCIAASGLLSGRDLQPEKTYKAMTLDAFQRVFAANTFGPALIAAQMLPLMPKTERSVFAALSARVGSISDNRLGGWHAYRASKAALNMLIRNFALEQARRAPGNICVGLHPGTVDTGLSRNFQGGVADGKLFTPAQAAAYLLGVVDRLSPEDSGKCFDWAGNEVPV
jgi:NAD(P)-dependent dehydrogenase (short-subunit alcohol dehydrogenase family)